ncbi:putative hydrolase of the HAD superfamily [Variovorax boronicumulans]|jgi:HAD superfamily hydrolase (TIGR01549 family)|uniref:HAD-superfamily hydrolase, subfamily IA, variant 1 n=1 Tax=Variovorax paradoxus (strain EPS) TaxID=595537 RepID=E6UW47_VARPE|nr:MULTISPECIES: HAD-IA family hydrolase [Variovorax]ADU37619.1 HAD-superfamily hydrolase, subfamily IA, variant 1 [Variovorax paradoxus EPS]MDH6165209.1 HAD superfamily hydrolase (TIGR01549 family) [Variovorax boronicumulans]MDP9993403.1 putative hydrolase of the HAD superfamily [Variovorax boronicumulans]MDQ0004730.1 putative hydrolase of the HAD superfamily [Variovorax boronicumulans]MDQ0034791.1 putative hydrolase of the HAD superfamily [Variovorax boronicumulans]
MTSAPTAPANAAPLDVQRISAISLDLDDTLWPIWPTIERAEAVLQEWLLREAPKTASLLLTPGILRELREATEKERSDLAHDLSALRRESIRTALKRSGEDPALADPAFDAFFAERQRVTLYDDALPALKWLSERYPLVAVSNGNADIHQTGVGRWFRTAFNARAFGSGKPHAPIFRAAAASVGLLPKDVLHVGDDAELDVVGALNAGMQAAWLVRDERPWVHGARPQLIVPNLHALCVALGA